MRKPTLEEFGLTEGSLKKYEQQEEEVERRLKGYLYEKEERRKKIGIASICVSAFILIGSIVAKFDEVSQVLLGICLFWDVIFGLVYFQSKGESTWSISWDTREKIKYSVIDKNFEQSIKDYEEAMRKYKKANAINQYSLVRVAMLLPSIDKKESVLAEQWIAFSNEYLANPRSFPDVSMYDWTSSAFRTYYNALMEKQKDIQPRPKKALNLDGELKFYYPCSDMFACMKGKNEGDKVTTSLGVEYRILEVRNIEE